MRLVTRVGSMRKGRVGGGKRREGKVVLIGLRVPTVVTPRYTGVGGEGEQVRGSVDGEGRVGR